MFDSIAQIFDLLFIYPITNLLVACYQLLNFLHFPSPLGFAIILLTIIIRIILWPFVSAQVRSSHKMQKLAPHMKRVRELHKNDSKKQQEALSALFKEHGVSPLSGCLPLLIQLPIIWSLYNVLTKVVGDTSAAGIAKVNDVLYFNGLKITHPWDPTFLGISLSAVPSKEFSQHPYLIAIPLITAASQFILSKMMIPEQTEEEKKALAVAKSKNDKSTKSKSDDFQTAFQTQSLYIFPVMIGFLSFTFPVGLSLYWNTFTIFGIIQQYLLVGAGGATPWFAKIKLGKK